MRTDGRTDGQTFFEKVFFFSSWSRIYIHVYTYLDYFSNFTPILTKVSIPFFPMEMGMKIQKQLVAKLLTYLCGHYNPIIGFRLNVFQIMPLFKQYFIMLHILLVEKFYLNKRFNKKWLKSDEHESFWNFIKNFKTYLI